jgi:hypothetical protein
MDNFRRGINSQVEASSKTGVAVCLPDFKLRNYFRTTGAFLGLVTKIYLIRNLQSFKIDESHPA